MNNIPILIGRDFSTRVKSSSYIITTMLGVLVIIALAFVPTIMNWIDARFEQNDVHLLLLDRTNVVTPTIQNVVAHMGDENQSVSVTSTTATSNQDAITEMRAESKIGLLVVEYDEQESIGYTLFTDNSSNINLNNAVQRIINQTNTQYNATELGLSLEEVSLLIRNPYLNIRETSIDSVDDGEEIFFDNHFQTIFLAYLLLFILYMTLILYGNMVATGVAEEKSSRIMEVMVSTVKPLHLMIGKIIGIGSLGLLQFGIWIATGVLVVTLNNFGFSIGTIPLDSLAWFGLLFVLGYLFYATIFAAAGALVSRVEEVQQVITIIMMLMIGGFFVAYGTMMNPNGTLATVASMIPFFSPMALFSRVALANPPAIQIIISLTLLVAGIIINTLIASKIYRVGILMYGKRPSIKEIFRVLTS